MIRLRFACMALLIAIFSQAQINTNTVITIGRNALYYEDYALSIQYFNQAIAAKPYMHEPYFYRAIAKYYLGDYYGSITDCSASIERDPFIDECFKLRAVNYMMLSKFDSATSDYKEIVRRDNKDQNSWYNLVLCQTKLKQYNSADSLLDWMIHTWPSQPKSYLMKAQVLMEKGDTINAETYINKTITLDSFNIDALSAKGYISLKNEHYSEAEKVYSKAILQSPKRSDFYINRAYSRYKQNNLQAAMTDYDIALDITPDNYQGHYNRGLLRMQVGENNLAIEDFNYVLNKKPSDRLALYNRAILHEIVGQYDNAIKDFTEVLKSYPNFLIGYEHRARCYRMIGNNDNALKDERHVFEERLDASFGTKKKHKIYKDQTRDEDNQEIENYDKLVVNEEEDKMAKFYTSEYRGKIQNRQVVIEPLPAFSHPFDNNLDKDIIQSYYLYNEACEETANGNIESAIQCLDKAIQLNPTFPEAYYNRGLLYVQKKDTKAFNDFSKAGELGLYSAYSLIKHFREKW